MSLKYGDVVTLIKKSPDGKELSRHNATVLGSFSQPDGAEKMSPKEQELKRVLKLNGKAPEGGEYLDLVYPRPDLVPAGSVVTTRDVSLVFQHAYAVPQWKEGAFIGWEPQGLPSAADLDAVAAEQKAAQDTADEPAAKGWKGAKVARR